jgi:hypothetical protein
LVVGASIKLVQDRSRNKWSNFCDECFAACGFRSVSYRLDRSELVLTESAVRDYGVITMNHDAMTGP